MTTPMFRRASTISTGGLSHTLAQSSAGRGRYSAVSVFFSLPISQCASGAAETKRSRAGAVPEHQMSRSPLKWLALESLGANDGLSVIKMFNFLVFGNSSELKDD